MKTLSLVLVLLQVALILGAELPGETAILAKTHEDHFDLVEEGTPEEGTSEEESIEADLLDGDLSLEALCENKKIELFCVSQFDLLVDQIGHIDESKYADCMVKTIPALRDFQTVIKEDEDHVCAMRKVELYEKFYIKYLHHHPLDKGFISLPKYLQKFILGYGMQLANACKRNIYFELNGQIKHLLSDEDFEKVAKYIHKKSPIVRLLGSTEYPDELFLPVDLLGPELASEQSDWAISEGAARENLESLKKRCERRFEPVYGPLMMPVARLTRLGFNYRDRELRKLLKDSKTRMEVGRWPRVVFLCELVKNIKLVPVDGSESSSVVDLGSDEMNSVSTLEDDISAVATDIEPIRYVEKFEVNLGDQILVPTDKALSKAIESTKTTLNSRWKLRLRQLSNFAGVLKDHLKHFRFHSVIAKMHKYFWRQQDFWFGVKDKNEEIRLGLEKELDPDSYLAKYKSEDLTRTQKFIRYSRKGLYLVAKATFTSLMVFLTLCIIVC